MKRYTKEFIADQIGIYSRCKNKPEQLIEDLKNILFYCEKGMITDFEAVLSAACKISNNK